MNLIAYCDKTITSHLKSQVSPNIKKAVQSKAEGQFAVSNKILVKYCSKSQKILRNLSSRFNVKFGRLCTPIALSNQNND
jgi:hypothetical protein